MTIDSRIPSYLYALRYIVTSIDCVNENLDAAFSRASSRIGFLRDKLDYG